MDSGDLSCLDRLVPASSATASPASRLETALIPTSISHLLRHSFFEIFGIPFLTIHISPTSLLSFLLVYSLSNTTASPAQKPLQDQITFSLPPLGYPISLHPPTTPEDKPPPVNVSFTLSKSTCTPLQDRLPYIVKALSTGVHAQHPNGITFPDPPPGNKKHLPWRSIGAEFREQLIPEIFVVGLAVELRPLVAGKTEMSASDWGKVMAMVMESALRLALGSVSVSEMEVLNMTVFAEWIFRRVVDGVQILCEG